MPTTLFRGGRIRADFAGAVHDSLLARDGRVVAVGTAADVRPSTGRVDETVDLGGAWVVPGLIDAHPHLLHFGAAAAGLADLSDAADHDDIVATITRIASGRAPGEWVMATPVGEPHYFFRRGHEHLREGALPDRVALDRATVRHPVMIQAWSPTVPNVCALNSAGLVTLGINAASPDRVSDVWIEKDAAGVPTGRLYGAVNSNYNTDPFFREILLRLPGPPSHLVEHGTLQGIAAHHRMGITAVYEPHAMEPRHIDVYRRLRDTGRLTMRVKAVPEYQRFTRPSDHQKSMAELAATLGRGARGGRPRRRVGARRGDHRLRRRNLRHGQHAMADDVPRRVRARDRRPLVHLARGDRTSRRVLRARSAPTQCVRDGPGRVRGPARVHRTPRRTRRHRPARRADAARITPVGGPRPASARRSAAGSRGARATCTGTHSAPSRSPT